MDKEEYMNLESGVVLDRGDVSLHQILKKISDGYLVLVYSSVHYVYDVVFIPFEDFEIYPYKISNEWCDEEIFDGKRIKHIDDFGHCKDLEYDS